LSNELSANQLKRAMATFHGDADYEAAEKEYVNYEGDMKVLNALLTEASPILSLMVVSNKNTFSYLSKPGYITVPYNFKLRELVVYMTENEHKARDFASQFVKETTEFEAVDEKL